MHGYRIDKQFTFYLIHFSKVPTQPEYLEYFIIWTFRSVPSGHQSSIWYAHELFSVKCFLLRYQNTLSMLLQTIGELLAYVCTKLLTFKRTCRSNACMDGIHPKATIVYDTLNLRLKYVHVERGAFLPA